MLIFTFLFVQRTQDGESFINAGRHIFKVCAELDETGLPLPPPVSSLYAKLGKFPPSSFAQVRP